MATQYYIQLWSKDEGTGVFSHATVPFGGEGDVIGMAAKDNGPAWTTLLGVSNARIQSADASGAGVNITDAPGAGNKVVLTDVMVASDTALSVDIVEETSGRVLYTFYLAANSAQQFTPRGKVKTAVANKKLKAVASGAGNISITPLYYLEA